MWNMLGGGGNLDSKLDVGFWACSLPLYKVMSMKIGFSCLRIGLMPIPIHFKEKYILMNISVWFFCNLIKNLHALYDDVWLTKTFEFRTLSCGKMMVFVYVFVYFHFKIHVFGATTPTPNQTHTTFVHNMHVLCGCKICAVCVSP